MYVCMYVWGTVWYKGLTFQPGSIVVSWPWWVEPGDQSCSAAVSAGLSAIPSPQNYAKQHLRVPTSPVTIVHTLSASPVPTEHSVLAIPGFSSGHHHAPIKIHTELKASLECDSKAWFSVLGTGYFMLTVLCESIWAFSEAFSSFRWSIQQIENEIIT